MKSVLQKLNKIRAEISVEKEFGKNYKSFTVAKLNAELNPLLVKHNIGIYFSIDMPARITTITKKSGTDKYGVNFERKITAVCGQIKYSVCDLDNGDCLDVLTPFIGMNEEGDPSKSQGNAHSYSYKYLWVILLGLTDEESDIDSPLNQSKVNNKSIAAKPNKTPKQATMLDNASQVFKDPYKDFQL